MSVRIRGAAVGRASLPMVASTASLIRRKTIGDVMPSFEVWVRHSLPARANEGIAVQVGARTCARLLRKEGCGLRSARPVRCPASKSGAGFEARKTPKLSRTPRPIFFTVLTGETAAPRKGFSGQRRTGGCAAGETISCVWMGALGDGMEKRGLDTSKHFLPFRGLLPRTEFRKSILPSAGDIRLLPLRPGPIRIAEKRLSQICAG